MVKKKNLARRNRERTRENKIWALCSPLFFVLFFIIGLKFDGSLDKGVSFFIIGPFFITFLIVIFCLLKDKISNVDLHIREASTSGKSIAIVIKEYREIRQEWNRDYLTITHKIKGIQNSIKINEISFANTQLLLLKGEIEEKSYNTECNNEKITLIDEIIKPLIRICKTQEEIMKKTEKLYLNFEKSNKNPEIARKFFDYYDEIQNLYFSNEITCEFFEFITEKRNKINRILKENFIDEEMKKILNSEINYDFLFRNLVNFFDISERWKILQKLTLNLLNIKPKQFYEYFDKGSIDVINRNIELLKNQDLENCFLDNIGLLVKNKHKIRKIINNNKRSNENAQKEKRT